MTAISKLNESPPSVGLDDSGKGLAQETAHVRPRPNSRDSLAEEGRELTIAVGINLRRLRVRRGLSLERLAQRSGVSRAMLSQIELGQSTPTISLLWKVARALDITFSTLVSTQDRTGPVVMRGNQAKRLSSPDGSFVCRPLFPSDAPRKIEFHEIELAPKAQEQPLPHPLGTTNNLIVVRGSLDVDVGASTFTLAEGDAMLFHSDETHRFRNPGTFPAIAYLVIAYNEDAD